MPKARVKIEGLSPLMMHRYPMEEIKALDKKSPEEQAEIAAHRNPQTEELFIPGVAIQRALVNAAVFSKGKGRASLQKVAAACLLVLPEEVGLGTKNYVIDSRAVVMPTTKGRVVRHRPKLESWKCSFDVEWDEELLNEPQVKKIVEDMGKRVGLLEFSPRCKGPYGRCKIVDWEVTEQ